jgi:glycosyltransferase involved in cell wall biosynthesis
MKAVLVIPALNEEDSIGRILGEVPAGLFDEVFVVDNGSTDATAQRASARGATVLHEPRRGYGNACLRALRELPPDTDVVVFMDGDGSDVPAEASRLLRPIADRQADLVLGSRELGSPEPGALGLPQRLGNRLATWLVRFIYKHRYTDLGPFRAIRASSLQGLGMRDPNYGWTVEMQIRALQQGLSVKEIPVSYRRRRAGASKVSSSLWGGLAAGLKILWLILRLSREVERRQPLKREP